MTRLSAISIIFLVLFFSVCFVPGQSIAEQKKVTGTGGSGYVIQMGAFGDQNNAERMISKLRFKGTEVFLARKDNGMYVVQSQSFTTRNKAHALAVRLVAGKLVDKYFITTTSSKIVSKSSGEEGFSKSHPLEIVQAQKKSAIDTPKETAERDTTKETANIPVALTALAWYHFRNDRYEEAYKYFSELNRIEPEQVEHVTGMIYALSGIKDFEKAMELAPAVNLLFYQADEKQKTAEPSHAPLQTAAPPVAVPVTAPVGQTTKTTPTEVIATTTSPEVSPSAQWKATGDAASTSQASEKQKPAEDYPAPLQDVTPAVTVTGTAPAGLTAMTTPTEGIASATIPEMSAATHEKTPGDTANTIGTPRTLPPAGIQFPDLSAADHTSGSKPASNPKFAKLKKKAEAGDAKAQKKLGWLYSSGTWVSADKSEAISWYKKAALQGDVEAQLALGWIYYSGDGVAADPAEAAVYYRMAAQKGNAKAVAMLKRLGAATAAGSPK